MENTFQMSSLQLGSVYPLSWISIIGLLSLTYSEILSILKGNKNPLAKLYEHRDKEKLSIVISEELVSLEAKKLAQDKLDAIAYRYITGITAEKLIQKKIVDCHRSACGRLDYNDFKKALAFIKVNCEGELKVRDIRLLDKVARSYWLFLSGTTFIHIYYLWSDLFTVQLSYLEQIYLILAIILHFTMIYSFIFQASTLRSVKKIEYETELLDLEQTIAQEDVS